jgi:hypothetical protein
MKSVLISLYLLVVGICFPLWAESSKVPPAIAAWTPRDIGTSGGDTKAFADGGFEITGSGSDIWDHRDQFRYVYQVCKGDFEIRCKVVSLENTNEWAKAGLMVRQSAAEDSIHLSLVASIGHDVHVQRRQEAGNESFDATAGPAAFPNCWLKIARKGNTLTCFISQNGETWRAISAASM